MSHPILQCLDVANVILQVPRGKRVPEFVEEEVRAVRTFRALVAMFRYALPAIQFRVECDALEFELVPLVWPARLIRKN